MSNPETSRFNTSARRKAIDDWTFVDVLEFTSLASDDTSDADNEATTTSKAI